MYFFASIYFISKRRFQPQTGSPKQIGLTVEPVSMARENVICRSFFRHLPFLPRLNMACVTSFKYGMQGPNKAATHHSFCRKTRGSNLTP